MEKLKKGFYKERRRRSPRFQEPREIGWATGAAIMVRCSALGGQPLFDERFFMYSEDADLCKRLAEGGWKRYYVPKAVVVHSHRGSSRKALFSMIFYLFQSMDLYYAKHKSSVGRFFLRLSIAMDMLIRILLLIIHPGKGSFRRENRERKKAYLKVLFSLNPFFLTTRAGKR